MVVHFLQSTARIDEIVRVCRKSGVFVVEDCAQAHGAIYDGRRVGTFGDIAAFSFQQSKVMTAGEGGMVITSSAELSDRVFRLHADGRIRTTKTLRSGLELEAGHGLMGANRAMSEFQAAVLLAQLPSLDARLRHSADNAASLDERLGALGLSCLRHPRKLERRTVNNYAVSVHPDVLKYSTIENISLALEAETGFKWGIGDKPIVGNSLYRPETQARYQNIQLPQFSPEDFPIAHKYSQRTLTFHHSVLQASPMQVDSIAAAIEKVLSNLEDLCDFDTATQSEFGSNLNRA